LGGFGARVNMRGPDAGFTCPNRDGSKGIGGCTFCNNKSFAPGARDQLPLAAQFHRARGRIARGTGARRFIAYFQA
jgi:radical SAM superfamily enzyme